MKSNSIVQTFNVGFVGMLMFLHTSSFCQKQSPAKPYDFSKDAPKIINDECDRAKRIFKRSHPKALDDPAIVREVGLKFESSWYGHLGPDSVLYKIIYYRCFDAGFLVVLKENKDGDKILAWRSPDIFSDRSSIQEPKDLNGDGKKEILFSRSGGNSGNTPLYIYSWEGDSALLIGEFGDWSEIKDLDGDGIAEVIESSRIEMPVDSTYEETEFYTQTAIYRWDGKKYQLWKKSKTHLPKSEERTK